MSSACRALFNGARWEHLLLRNATHNRGTSYHGAASHHAAGVALDVVVGSTVLVLEIVELSVASRVRSTSTSRVRAPTSSVLNVLVYNDFFATPAIAMDLYVSSDNITIVSSEFLRSLAALIRSAAAAPHDTEDDAKEADTEYHKERNHATLLCLSGCFLAL